MVVTLIVLAVVKQSSVSYLTLKAKESLGYPGLTYTMPHFSLRLPDPNMMVFVSMTTKPQRLSHVETSFAAIPEDYRVRKILVVPPSFQDSTSEQAVYDKTELHRLVAGHRMQVLKVNRDYGPLLKIWAVTDPVTAFKLGAVRDKDSKHIFVTLDDDMYYHQDLLQALVNRIVETNYSSVVAVKTRENRRVDNSVYREFVGSYGVAYPARIWTAAFRGDVKDCMLLPQCQLDDDSAISFALARNNVNIVELPRGDWSVPSSIGANYDSVPLQNTLCKSGLANMPML